MVKKKIKKLQEQGLDVIKFTSFGIVAGQLPASPATASGQAFFTRASSQFGTAGLIGGTALSLSALESLQPKKRKKRRKR